MTDLATAATAIKRWREKPQVFVREVFGVTPDPWQDDVLEAFPHKQRIAMKASKGPGKAQPKDTMIPTPAGVRRFGDLRPGDLVFTADGSPTPVKAVYDRGELPVYRITFDDYSSTLACGEHLWRVRGAAERVRKNSIAYQRDTAAAEVWSTLTTEQIIARGVRTKNNKGLHRQFEIPRQGAVQYQGKALPIDPYVLGVWLGDGVRLSGRYATKPTPEIEEEIRARGYDTSGARDGIVAVYGIVEALRSLGVLGTYSHERFIPRPYLEASVRGRQDLLRGLLDTDCGVDKDGHMEYASTSPQLAQDVVWLVRSLGGTAHQTKIKMPFYYGAKRQKINGRPCHRVVIRLPFNPFLVPQRRARWVDPYRSRATSRYMTRFIDRIEPEGAADCMCIEVGHPSGLYLTNDFIVTHNTAVEAWLAWCFLLTRPHPKIAATSVSAENLSDNLWTEMAKWQHKSEPLKAAFEWTKTRIVARDHPETWWMSARNWSKTADATQQSNTLAGLHADYILFILDESGSIPDAVMASAEAALSTCIEGHILQGGNPTMLSGPLYRAATTERALWHVVEVNGDPDNPKRSPRVSIQWARDQIAKYGRDNPWVLVNVFGRFPPASLNTLIGPDEVQAAMERTYREDDYRDAAKVLGVDVARFGDDASVVFPRQGLMAFPPLQYRNLDGTQGAGAVVRKWDDWQADACFVDDTGGYGASWIDNMVRLGKSPIGIPFSGEPIDPRYVNKRAEMAFELVEWIKRGGSLPQVPELLAALTQTTYTFKGDKLLIEPKDQIKVKLGYSPDHMDGLMLTFAHPVTPKPRFTIPGGRSGFQADYNPMAEAWSKVMGGQGRR